jgi:hypothetical protein
MVANPFSHENRPSQSYGLDSSASINVKTGFPDPVDFVTTRLLIYWRVLAIRAMVGGPLPYRGRHSAICQWTRSRVVVKFAGCGILGKVPWHTALWRPWYANGGPNHCANCHCQGSSSRVVAKSVESGELVFTSMDMYGTLRTIAYRRPIFKHRKA